MAGSTDVTYADGDDAPTQATIDAVGAVTEALECIERARGHLYSFHQLIGRAHKLFGPAADQLTEAGWDELAERMHREVEARDVLPERWTFQIVEEFDAGYWQRVREFVDEVRETCVGGQPHLSEALMKRNGVTE
jgi:hypothetical protein